MFCREFYPALPRLLVYSHELLLHRSGMITYHGPAKVPAAAVEVAPLIVGTPGHPFLRQLKWTSESLKAIKLSKCYLCSSITPLAITFPKHEYWST